VILCPARHLSDRQRRLRQYTATDSVGQGNIYQAIIDKVIQASQNDFEEFGVDQATLGEMREVCILLSLARVVLHPLFLHCPK
jgi:hypothetical protein